MTNFRDGKVIALTEAEICEIYIEARKRNYEDEVKLKLSEDYDVDLNIEVIDIAQITEDVVCAIAEDDTIWDCEQDIFKRVIERYLEERGIK